MRNTARISHGGEYKNSCVWDILMHAKHPHFPGCHDNPQPRRYAPPHSTGVALVIFFLFANWGACFCWTLQQFHITTPYAHKSSSLFHFTGLPIHEPSFHTRGLTHVQVYVQIYVQFYAPFFSCKHMTKKISILPSVPPPLSWFNDHIVNLNLPYKLLYSVPFCMYISSRSGIPFSTAATKARTVEQTTMDKFSSIEPFCFFEVIETSVPTESQNWYLNSFQPKTPLIRTVFFLFSTAQPQTKLIWNRRFRLTRQRLICIWAGKRVSA